MKPEEASEKGDQYRVGKRNQATCDEFCFDLHDRVLGEPQISTDGFAPYASSIRRAFGNAAHHGRIVKRYAHDTGNEAARRYSPGVVVAVERDVVRGWPGRISTSYVERSNLTMRMNARRMTRLTNGFSKKLENHVAAIGLYVTYYNFCRVHETIGVPPTRALAITDHNWSIAELVEAALAGELPDEPEGRQVGRFQVIDGGLT